MPPDVLIVADDVTGALDSAAAFAARGLRTTVALAPAHLDDALAAGADVVAVATNTRERPPAFAKSVLGAIRRSIRGVGCILFKKVDSRMKGQIATEIDALMGPDRRPVLACPAIPRLGRHVAGGAVCGAGVARPIAILPKLGRPAQVPDAASDAELRAALPGTLTGTLFVGAAGLAEALAWRMAPDVPPRHPAPPPLPALFAIGSRDPVTAAQVEALARVPVLAAPNGAVPSADLGALTVIRMTQGAEKRSGKAAGEAFADGIAALLAACPVATLLACGGETAAGILRRRGIGRLEVLGELLPGVPLARSVGAERPLTIITKSGGFGSPQTLADLAALLTAPPAAGGDGRPGTKMEA